MTNGEEKSIVRKIKDYLFHIITLIWWHAPIKRRMRKRIKDFVFGNFSFFFKPTRMYRCWQDARMLEGVVTYDNDKDYPENWPKLIEHKTIITSFPKNPIRKAEQVSSLAIVIHAYYTDILQEALSYLGDSLKFPCKLFVTCPNEKAKEIEALLKSSGYDYDFLMVENRGRDILPFLKISKHAVEQGFNLLLKIHTKKSDHRMTGYLWRKEIFRALLPVKQRNRIIESINTNHLAGIVGPSGHIVPMSLYFGANAKALGYLSRQIGVDTKVINELTFIAGSMFYIRKEALMPLLSFNPPDEIFEMELGQSDGTMAHAYERAFSVSAFAAGLKIVDTNFKTVNSDENITSDHPYTW